MCKAVPVLEAILLVGGQGTRLRPLTIETPKPMLPVAGRPCTEHQIARLRDAGVTRVILGTSYRADVFADYFGDGSAFGVELVCVTEAVPLGTGGAIRNVLSELKSGPDDPVLILNGDVLSGHDMAAQVAHHRAHDADVTLHLINVDDPRPFGLVQLRFWDSYLKRDLGIVQVVIRDQFGQQPAYAYSYTVWRTMW